MKSRIHFYVGILILSLQTPAFADLWQTVEQTNSDHQGSTSVSAKKTPQKHQESNYQKAQILKLDEQQMRLRLAANGAKSSQAKALRTLNGNHASVSISAPLSDGTIIELSLVPETTLSAHLASKFPNIDTYRVLPNNQIFGGKVDITSKGFHAMLQTIEGDLVFIDPIDVQRGIYATYRKSEQNQDSYRQFSCGVSQQEMISDNSLVNDALPTKSQKFSAKTSESLIDYRIAIAATGEYTAKHGGTVEGALSAITTTISRVNQVLERDLGIHLTLVENNDLLIHTDAGSDPFTETELVKLVYQNQEYLDAVIGSENYDIGHLFSASGGGLAAIASVCNGSDKAKGVSGIANPVSDSFDLDFVAHEIGHQLGATHTFNSTQGLCSGITRTAETAFEPGSGSTIMSYAGYCGLDNLQTNADAMYHIGSIQQIASFTNTGGGNQCGDHRISQNQPPVPDAGNNYIIPARTPFELRGQAYDINGDTLVYAWQQLDVGDSSTEDTDKGNNALFRVHTPTDKTFRSFPPLPDILQHTKSKGETLPEQERSLRFSFTAQDGFNSAQSDEMTILVKRTGSRFALNLPRSKYVLGETYKIFWNVANTDMPPVNCASVDISLSTDGGNNFSIDLAKNVANNGEAWVTIPVDAAITSQGRFKLKCSDNIFFALSYRDFELTGDNTLVTDSYDDEDQPEPELKDVIIEALAISSNEQSSAGGSFSFLLFFLGLLTLRNYRGL